ncbi:Cyclic dehypoxanthine futalosine synthase [Streptomyces hirsutus]
MLSSALWPRGVTDDVREALLDRLRAWLGTDPDGTPRLGTDRTGRLTLAQSVVSDLDVLRSLSSTRRPRARASTAGPCAAWLLDRRAGAITRIHAAGLDSFAGAGAELLPERPRKAIAPLKESGERWLEIMEIAHGLGVESTSTMLMGTGETNAERIEHLRMIRDVQDRTGGFRAFIPYTYQPENNHLKGRTQATLFEYLRMIAIARVFLDNVAHIQGSWLTTGKEVGQLSLHYGADDLGSIMLEENVVSSAGAKHRSNRLEIIDLIRRAGRVPAQRSTTYEHLVVHDDPADDPVDDRVASHISSTAIEGGTAHPELKLLASN